MRVLWVLLLLLLLLNWRFVCKILIWRVTIAVKSTVFKQIKLKYSSICQFSCLPTVNVYIFLQINITALSCYRVKWSLRSVFPSKLSFLVTDELHELMEQMKQVPSVLKYSSIPPERSFSLSLCLKRIASKQGAITASREERDSSILFVSWSIYHIVCSSVVQQSQFSVERCSEAKANTEYKANSLDWQSDELTVQLGTMLPILPFYG